MAKKISKYIFWCIIIITMIFLALYIPRLILNKTEAKEKALKINADKNAKIISDKESMERENENLQEYISRMKTVKTKSVTFKDNLVNIERCLPVDVTIKSLSYDKELIKIKANTKDHDSISEFAAKIQLLDKYKDARVLDINFDKLTRTYDFNINVLY